MITDNPMVATGWNNKCTKEHSHSGGEISVARRGSCLLMILV